MKKKTLLLRIFLLFAIALLLVNCMQKPFTKESAENKEQDPIAIHKESYDTAIRWTSYGTHAATQTVKRKVHDLLDISSHSSLDVVHDFQVLRTGLSASVTGDTTE